MTENSKNNRGRGVTFIIIRSPGEILMQLRDSNCQYYPYMWCFPGGLVEDGEKDCDALKREIREEYDLKIEEKSCALLMVHDLERPFLNVGVFICKAGEDQVPKLKEGADMKWMTLEEIKSLQLAFEQGEIIPVLEKYLAFKKLF